jgi:hypothetical protein
MFVTVTSKICQLHPGGEFRLIEETGVPLFAIFLLQTTDKRDPPIILVSGRLNY